MAGRIQADLKPGGSLQAPNAVINSKTSATVDGSVDMNRNGETAPIMSRTQNFNDPPFLLLHSNAGKSISIQ